MSWRSKFSPKMNSRCTLMIVFGILLATVALLKPPISLAQDIQGPVTRGKVTQYPNGVYKIEPEAFGITGPVRDLPTSDPDALAKGATVETGEKEINKLKAVRVKTMIPGAGAGEGPFQDPLVNRGRNSTAPRAMATPSLTFDGATTADNAAQGIGGLAPPDANGDVGLNHYVSSVNEVYKIFNKNGTVAAGPFKTSSLFNGLPPGDQCRSDSDDPVVVYDSLADRWHISQRVGFGGPAVQCIALSVTG